MHQLDSILSVLHGPFLLDGAALQGFMLQVSQVMTGKVKAEDLGAQARSRSPFQAHASALGLQGYQSLDEVPAGSVAVHVVSGVMLPGDSWFGQGTASIGQGVVAADQHPNIVAHVGVFNTPGGSTMGLEDFASLIGATQKPFVGYASQACSAGCWSIAGSNAIVLAGRTAMMGSIGTKAEFLDFSGYFKQLGIEQISIKATKSSNKNRSFDEAIAGNPEPLRAEILDPLNEVFLDTMLECRGDKIPAKQQGAVLSGLVFVGQDCLDKGLADQLGSFDDAVQLARQLAGTTSASSTSSSMGLFGNKVALGAAMQALVGAAAVTAEMATAANAELKDAGITGAALITEATHRELETGATAWGAASEALTAAGATDVAALAASRDQYKTSLDTITSQLQAAGVADVAALVKERDQFKAEAEKFGGQPGEMGTSSQKKKADVSEEGADEHTKAISELPHNKSLEGHPMFG